MHIANSTRLSYRLMDKTDAEFLYQLDQDPDVMHHINGGHKTRREDIEQIILPRMDRYKNSEKGWGQWKVTMIETQQDIGWIIVRPMGFFSDSPQWDNLELGWRFFQSSWGKGYASEAAMHLKNALSVQDPSLSFCAIANESNDASIHIMKKMGMTYVKTYLHHDPLGDVDVVLYQLAS
ncbi:GNAT family N-acetyltransferase [Shewanella surugensis]|uniref:GNAT family N-acetyltransferase n=1 Tax=Shewanella surugensis TaxID=212020 RepID=A0ABT0LAV8_9GAMM|nr:GNAT family N-acetyltransferase [Shewanella surugensis]MCL1124832.1 GNAT family N-acetyltransferase [Shewanella surugensis]